MKLFKVVFKDKTEFFVKAHMWVNNVNSGREFQFFKDSKERNDDVYISSHDVLYIESLGDVPDEEAK